MRKYLLFVLLLLVLSWCKYQWNISWANKKDKPVIKKIVPSWNISSGLQEKMKANSIPGF